MREVIIETEAMSRFDNAVDEVAAADHGLSGFILAYGQDAARAWRRSVTPRNAAGR